MALLTELEVAVRRFFRETWDESEGTTVPEAEDVRLYNHGIRLDAVVLYADIAESTKMGSPPGLVGGSRVDMNGFKVNA